MLRIVSHIENLLLSHDCVIVPGIGGFVTHFEEASFSEDGTEIYPPYCSVSFNSHLSDKEDKYGMLAQSYMTAYDINYPRALALVSDDVAALREQLRQKMELQIGTIGTLQLTLNYSLLFTPSDECGIFAKELYGLVQSEVAVSQSRKVAESQSSSYAPVRSDAAATPSILEGESSRSMVNGQLVNVKTSKPIVERDADNTHYIIRVSKSAVRYTVTTIAAALLYFVFTIAPSVSPLAESKVQEATILNVAKSQSPKVAKTEVADAKEAALQSEEKVEAAPAETYTLVLASAVSKKGALNLIEDLKEEGFAEAQMMDDDGMTRVIYSCYPTEDAAHQAAKQLRQQHKRFQSAWVMKM